MKNGTMASPIMSVTAFDTPLIALLRTPNSAFLIVFKPAAASPSIWERISAGMRSVYTTPNSSIVARALAYRSGSAARSSCASANSGLTEK